MKQTALHQTHIQLKAKMAEFQGWSVPFQYSGVQEEHQAVRTAAGLFDVSYLGRIEVSGPDSLSLLDKTFTRSLAKFQEGMAVYGLFCNEGGFIMDDSLLFNIPKPVSGSRYIICTNAANTEKVLSWLRQNAGPDVSISDMTSSTYQFSLQGPRADSILERLCGGHFKKIKHHHIRKITIADTSVLVSRTGYTGEQGYELIMPVASAEALWNAVMEAGKDFGISPCGLGSRDILRLEMGYVMYGNDIDETRTPLEAGLDAFVDLKKEFIGKDALAKQKASGVKYRLTGFILAERVVPKCGSSIFSENREIGFVTSAGYSPSMFKTIGLGYVLSRYSQPGQEIEIEVKDREIAARIVERPFYRKK